MNKLCKLQDQLIKARERVAQLEEQYAELRLKELRSVTMTKNGATLTLSIGDRVIKAKKPARYNDRWNLTENGKSIAREVFGSIHDIRFAIAMGHL